MLTGLWPLSLASEASLATGPPRIRPIAARPPLVRRERIIISATEPAVQAPLGEQAVRAALWNIGLIPLQAAAALAGSIVVARALTRQEFTHYGLATAAVTSLLLLTDLGLTALVNRRAPELRAAGSVALAGLLKRTALTRTVALAVCALLLAGARAAGHGGALVPFGPAGLLLILAIAWLLGLSRLEEYLLSGVLDRRRSGIARLVAGVAQPTLVAAAALSGTGVDGILVALLVAALIELATFHLFCRPYLSAHSGAESRRWTAAESARFAAVAYLEKVASYVTSAPFVVLLLAGFGRSDEVAPFVVAGELTARAVGMLALPMAGLALPLLATVDVRNSGGLGTALRLLMSLLCLLALPVGALLTVLAEPTVTVLYSSRFRDAAPLVSWLTPFLFLEYVVSSTVQAALLVRGRYRTAFLAKLPLLLAALALFVVVPRGGGLAAAITYGAARLLAAVLTLGFGARDVGFALPVAPLARITLASGVSAVCAAALTGVAGTGLVPLTLVTAGALVPGYAVFRLSGGLGGELRAQLTRGAPRFGWLARLA